VGGGWCGLGWGLLGGVFGSGFGVCPRLLIIGLCVIINHASFGVGALSFEYSSRAATLCRPKQSAIIIATKLIQNLVRMDFRLLRRPSGLMR